MKLSRWAMGTKLIMALWLLSMTPLLAIAQPLAPTIDLATLPNDSELTGLMQQVTNPRTINRLSHDIDLHEQDPIMSDTLTAPRQNTTLWLTATVHNSANQALTRWLVIQPWRVHRVDAYFIDPISNNMLSHEMTGIKVADSERSVSNGKAIIPVHLNSGETQQVILKVYSDSLPLINITSWDPTSYSQSINESRLIHIALLAGIVTLLLILALQFNISLILTGLWLLVAFIFESEKNGFISHYLFSSLADYAFNLRVSTWVLTEQLFLIISVCLLGLKHSRAWQNWIAVTVLATLLLSATTFITDSNQVRQFGIVLTSAFAISWLFIIVPALRIKRPQQRTLLRLLGLYWLISSFLLLGYTFNFYYTTAFAAARIYIELAIALALILSYSWQQKQQLSQAQLALKKQQARHQQQLEKTVQTRTAALNSALDTAKNTNQAAMDFLGQVSHDLRAPLTAILGYAQLQASGTINDHKANHIIQEKAQYMKELVDGLVDYTKDITLEQNEPRELYLLAFIDNLANQAHLLAQQHDNRFQLKVETELPTVIRCYHLYLQRILINLLDNAAKYTQGGYISLAVSVTKNTQHPQALQFCVTDTGQGMSPDQLERAHLPFYQSNEQNTGSGLGLAICFELVERLEGELHINSQPNQGTQITCTVPFLLGDELQTAPNAPAMQDLLPHFNAQGKSAWVVEGSPATSELLSNELTTLGFNTKLATHAEGFIKVSQADTSEPALIITDYYLLGASGLEVLCSARERWPNVPVILLSANPSNMSASASAQPLQHCAYISKPIDLLELRLTIAKLCKV